MVEERMRNKEKKPIILVYRRTHKGDPDENGVFGINNCMKSVRDWPYDAVIGIGGVSPDKGDEDIAKKINWIGITPKKDEPSVYGIPERERRDAISMEDRNTHRCVTFEKFKLFEETGHLVKDYAPKLFKYMFEQGRIPRTGKNFNEEIYAELLNILSLADDADASKAMGMQSERKKKISGSACKPLSETTVQRKCSK